VDERGDTLVILTRAYPFDAASEPFLEPELRILTRHFARIIVLPSRTTVEMRSLPCGVRCEILLADLRRVDIVREALRRPARSVVQYMQALVKEDLTTPYLLHARNYLRLIGFNLLKYRLLKNFVRREGLADAVFYDYWLENSTLALSLLRREGAVHRAVARAHRFDLYDEASPAGAVPFRAFNVESLDRVFPVSAHGLAYLADRHPSAGSKLMLSRLGVEAPPSQLRRERGEVPLIVSCSSLKPFKCVHRIPEVLARIGRSVRWVHFGDGPCRAVVAQAAAALPTHVDWKLMGHVDHDDIIRFFERHVVDLFLSLSSTEGLPVSMMEAISFGTPVLATAVGGVPEVVTSRTGRLVSVDEPAESIAQAARDLLNGEAPPPDVIVGHFRENFEAGKNFAEFADLLRAV
jgi:glycosyltransferase involved in cell wall biosynthesis